MTEMPSSSTISTKLHRIAKLVNEAPQLAFTSLAHHMDEDFLHEAHSRTRKDAAVGVDGQTATDYAVTLKENLRSLLIARSPGSTVPRR